MQGEWRIARGKVSELLITDPPLLWMAIDADENINQWTGMVEPFDRVRRSSPRCDDSAGVRENTGPWCNLQGQSGPVSVMWRVGHNLRPGRQSPVCNSSRPLLE